MHVRVMLLHVLKVHGLEMRRVLDFRCEQKRITQEYLKMARQHLQDVLTLMQDLEEKHKGPVPGSVQGSRS
jgi:hypothetical protein